MSSSDNNNNAFNVIFIDNDIDSELFMPFTFYQNTLGHIVEHYTVNDKQDLQNYLNTKYGVASFPEKIVIVNRKNLCLFYGDDRNGLTDDMLTTFENYDTVCM